MSDKLIMQIQRGDHEQLKKLLKKLDPVAINLFSGNGDNAMTPLHFAVMMSNVQCSKILKRHGADPNVKVQSGIWAGKSAFEIAEDCGYDDILEILNTDYSDEDSEDKELLAGLMEKEKELLALLSEAKAQAKQEGLEDVSVEISVKDQIQELKDQITLLKEKNNLLEQQNIKLTNQLNQQAQSIQNIFQILQANNLNLQ
eukprot:TRINITY_DN2377_c0_g1_i1.p1 TRINITY_DN2377_c0_g1~~TRINITY_DN2377_c0_g1_i1.p1  ORF type:complete len:209 (+),score=70.96 TRINITY_DN2377_c0_g1_i1:30-629(+)